VPGGRRQRDAAAEVVNATGSFRTFYLQHMWEAMSVRLVRDEPVLFADLA